jgi:uncharacterized phiE125 gp8 family phage protein
MKNVIITPVVTEPLSLAEVKLNLRLSSDTLSGDLATYQSIVPGAHIVASAFSLVGTAFDVLGLISVVNLNSGTCGSGGSITAKIQESDDNLVWADFEGGAFTVVTEANDNAVQEIDYTGKKQYIRVVATIAVATCDFSSSVITMSGDTVEDSILSDWITAAREYCEEFCGRALATQTREAYTDTFGAKTSIYLPFSPLQSVTSVKYKNSVGVETTLVEDTDYIVDTYESRIVLPYGKTWVSFTPYTVNPIKIRFVCGYYASNLIPKSIKSAMQLLVAHWYENRAIQSEAGKAISKPLAFSVRSLLSNYRMRWWDSK